MQNTVEYLQQFDENIIADDVVQYTFYYYNILEWCDGRTLTAKRSTEIEDANEALKYIYDHCLYIAVGYADELAEMYAKDRENLVLKACEKLKELQKDTKTQRQIC